MTRSQRGFTLLELIVTVAILGILSASLIQAIGGWRSRAYEAVAVSYMRSWVAAQQLYLLDTGHFADSDDTLAGAPYKVIDEPTDIPYTFTIDSGANQTDLWWGSGTPTVSGLRYFCINQYGVVQAGLGPQDCQPS